MLNVDSVEAVLRTDQGQVRDHNEDFVAYYEPVGRADEVKNGWLYLVADGVGGAEAGEVASQVACEQTLAHYLADGQTSDPAERLVTAIRRANDELRRMVSEREIPVHMATTLVGAAILGNRAYLANVGD
ncbi:MAG: protein phosphatase 2C domain-containing protein, partial [Candidatus Promineifilaceae bacterium]|nr:protein phosphatase 2C domain-containing protein [Candidatus Promineifilaceae bacterium]